MEILNIISAVASILGLLISVFVAFKVTRIESIANVAGDGNVLSGSSVAGDGNVLAGGDVKQNKSK